MQKSTQNRIEELYVNGDSVSVGYGLDPALWKDISGVSAIIERDRYSAIVGRHFSLKENNDAKRASSNDSIVRRTINSLTSLSDSSKLFVVIGWSGPFRSEIRYDEKYIRMFFGRDSKDGYDYCNQFFFGMDLSDNEFRIKDYLRLCNLLSVHCYDDEFLAERLLQQIILLQDFLKSRFIPYLFIPIIDIGLLHSAFRSHRRLINAIDSNHYLRLEDALDGWSFIGECERRGYLMCDHHPMQDGHAYIAEEIIHTIEDKGLI